MNTRVASPRVRTGALALLAALLLLAPAQAVLESREATATQAAFEARHFASCLQLHDHRFCVLSGRTPWAPASGVRAITLPRAHLAAATPCEDDPPAQLHARLTQARSPPFRA